MDIIVSRRFPLADVNAKSRQETLREIATALKKELKKALRFTSEEGDQDILDMVVFKGSGKATPGILLWGVRFEATFEIDYCEPDSTVRIGVRGRRVPPGWLPLTLGALAFFILGILALIWFALVYGGYVFAVNAPAKSIEGILEKIEHEFSNEPI